MVADILARVQQLQMGVKLDVRFIPELLSCLRADLDARIPQTRHMWRPLTFPRPLPTPVPVPVPTSASASTPQVNSNASDGSGWGSVKYIELHTTPRAMPHMSFRVYLKMVLDKIEARAPALYSFSRVFLVTITH